MKNKKGFIVLGVICAMFLSCNTVFAMDDSISMRAQKMDDVQTFVSENTARIVGTPRGMLISSVTLSLTDQGGGTIGIYADVLCHEPMEKIRLYLYLDQWINGKWEQLEKYTFEWNADDYPNDDLTMATVSFDVPDLDRGCDYQLRGIAGAWDLDSDYYEVFRAEVPSLLLE